MKNKITRRQFVEITAIGAAGLVLQGCQDKKLNWRFFTDEEAGLMNALADQIIPPDEWPGGNESGATNFIDKQLNGPYKRFKNKYRLGLASIKTTCEKIYHKSFENLEWEEQTLFLETMEAGKLEGDCWKNGFDREFFSLFRDHIMQSYYGSKRHGGNKNNMSYKMLKLDYPLIVGQNRY
ncbi:MAG: gluconate 2-dehydrogenase subunit 3 family protein [Bacteroidales bacterium]